MTRNGPKIVTLKYGSNFIASDVKTYLREKSVLSLKHEYSGLDSMVDL